MSNSSLSILIPSRNEMFLKETVEDIVAHREAETEVIVVLDGCWPVTPLETMDRVSVIHLPEPVGQRAASNIACRLSRAKYVMKVDAHCSFDQGFDRKMLEGFAKVGDDVTMVPIMRNLWAFDWKCMKCGKKWYQGPTPTKCQETNYKGTKKPCDSTKFKRKMMWVGKHNPQSTTYCFDSTPHFQYFNDYKRRPEYIKGKEEGLTETLSLQGSCFMITRENYWKWDVCDEKAGSWGNQGIEVALATWFNGGRVLCNHSTWYAHLFRTQGGDFGFPYEQKGREVQKTKNYIKDKYWSNPKLKELLKQFWPVSGWSEKDLEALNG